jgi:D-threo-aldose 1-dehydrogenase
MTVHYDIPRVCRPIGSTGLNVPALGFGAAPLGSPSYARHLDSDGEAIAAVRHALAAGVNFFDTAPAYGDGLSERRLGLALYGLPRTSYVLQTKVTSDMTGKPPDFTRSGVMWSIEESLARLRTHRLDIVLIHDPEGHYREAVDVVFPLLAGLRSQGVVRAIGVGMMEWPLLMDFARDTDVDCLLHAGRYTLLEQGALGLLNLCQGKGIAVFLGAVFATGILATGARPGARYFYREAPPEIMERARRIEAVCAAHGVPLTAAALQFPLSHPAVASLVVGMQTPDEVDANLASLSRPIPPAFWNDLRSAGLLDDGALIPDGPAENRRQGSFRTQ